MTAAELYEIVKDDPEVWGETIGYDQGLWYDRWGTVCAVSAKLAAVVLEGCYARATGCGVMQVGIGMFGAFDECVGVKNVRATGPTRLAALVAAYRASKETKR